MFRCVKILLFPSDLIKASNRIQCASLFFAQLKGSQIKEKKKMPEITVTKGIELIITLNNHNFLFNYSHSTQWKLSFPPDFSLTFWTLKNYNNKTTTYRLAGCVFFLFNAKYKVYIVIFVFGVWHYFNMKDWDWKYLAIKKKFYYSNEKTYHYIISDSNTICNRYGTFNKCWKTQHTCAGLNIGTLRKADVSLFG